MSFKAIALIPARKGSARVPGKNMILLNGRPLLWYAIRGAKESGQFDRIVVSTDWNECVTLAENMGVDALLRPDELCTDQAHDYQWVRHAIDAHPSYDAFVILRPTSPFRTAETIKRAMDEFIRVPCDSMRAVERTTAHPKRATSTAFPTMTLQRRCLALSISRTAASISRGRRHLSVSAM
jgi:CMP-N,N'-diacetyllegionaminic acid synthase